MTDLIRKSDALAAAHEADSLELQLHGASKIADRISALEPVAAPDPAATREAALREAAEVAKSWHRQWSMYSNGNEPTRDDRAGGITYGRQQGAETIAAAILALIHKGAADV